MAEHSLLKELRETQERLRLSEQRLKTSQKITRVGSWELELVNPDDIDVNNLYWSDQTYVLFGYEPGTFKPSNERFFQSVHPDDRSAIKEAVLEALATGKNYDIEHRIVLPDGSIRFVHEISEVIMDPQTNKPLRMLGTVQDITEQRKLRDQLMIAQKMECVGRLSGSIAHDFNNLLCAIYSNIEALEKHTTSNETAERYLKNIRTAAERGTGLIRRLLTFSRRQNSKPSYHDLNDLLLEAYEMIGPLLGPRVELSLSLSPKVGKIPIDAGQLNQVIMNLALNARDAMPSGGTLHIATSEVQIKESQELDIKAGHYARLTVRDNGHGMSEDVLINIFEPLFTTKDKGTGLGLPIVYGIVKQSGGHIVAESEPGKGTKFEIFLPACKRASRQKGAEHSMSSRHLSASTPA